ncbi:MAG: MFS transporter [Gammaproteobacteria bacterium]|nr:MFS transporter [Gammaproteobacteria bacterium]
MNLTEWRATFGLGAVYALRMIGMFMILPVFALYARGLPHGATPQQIGLALGIYGLTQSILQIPLGMVSDRVGRKRVISLGMLVFAAGSLVAGLARSIEWIVIGRALQGAGAVSSAVSALLADTTRDEVRTQAMTVVGVGMGAAFILALVLGPALSHWIGVDGLFLLTAALALSTLPVVWWGVPDAIQPAVRPGSLRAALADPRLLRLDAGIFILHAMLTALFLAAPLALEQTLNLPGSEHWKVYLPVMLASIVPVFPFIRRVERQGRMRQAFLTAIAACGLGLATLAVEHGRAWALLAALTVFFMGFNFLEGALPSLISRLAPADQKGAALGVYSSAQFLGAFAGGILGGWAATHWGMSGVFAVTASLPVVWFVIAACAPAAPYTEQRKAEA